MKRLLLALLLACGSSGAWAACTGSGLSWSCSSGSSAAQCQSAVDSATDGATITFSGTFNWGGSVCQTIDKVIHFDGGGNGTGATVGAGTGSATINEGGFYIGGDGYPCPGPAAEVHGFTFNNTYNGIQPTFLLFCAQGWRIHHNTITYDQGADMLLNWGYEGNGGAASIDGAVEGLFDHNDCTYCRSVYYGSVGGHGNGNYRWAEPLALGSVHYVYYEDNNFDFPLGSSSGYLNTFDGNWGCRYVVRHNTINNGRAEWHSLQGDSQRGCRAFELYNNTWTNNADPSYRQWFLRAGTGVVFHESADGNAIINEISLDNDRSHECSIAGSTQCSGGSGSGQVPTFEMCGWDGGVEQPNGNSFVDGNNAGGRGYPCRDQIGRSTDASLWSDSFTNPAPSQSFQPVYIWKNTDPGGEIAITLNCEDSGIPCSHQSTYHIVENRDYYHYNASFDGSAGVGEGARASRPSSCTPLVGYWSTDGGVNWDTSNGSSNDGCLDVCETTNTWTDCYYTPYTYPHPLQGGAAPSVPSAPTGLRIIGDASH